MNTPQHLRIPLGGDIRIEAFDQLDHITSTLMAGAVTLRQIDDDGSDLRAVAHRLLDDLIDTPLAATTLAPDSLIVPAEIAALLGQPITLAGQSHMALAPLVSCGEAADAVQEVLDGMEEAYHDDFFPDDDSQGGRAERRRLRALRLAVNLLTLLGGRL